MLGSRHPLRGAVVVFVFVTVYAAECVPERDLQIAACLTLSKALLLDALRDEFVYVAHHAVIVAAVVVDHALKLGNVV